VQASEPERIWTPTGWVDGPKTAAKPAGPVESEGRLIAYDVVQKRLDNIRPRLQRAGVMAELIQLGPNGGGVEDMVGQADVVLVDAPCTGSGTWRRRPEDAWRLKPEEVDRMHSLQMGILARAAKLVKPGGRLVYVTCSMLRSENEATVDAFEEDHPTFQPVAIAGAADTAAITDAGQARLSELAQGHRLRLSPASANTDGFFAALYERDA
jgi:16S rRNA (cytosine967-C5)-methyltransferase